MFWQEPSGASSAAGVFIDGDNTSHEYIDRILGRTMDLAPLLVPRIYGNWDLPTMQGWQRMLIPYRLERRHHQLTTPGKNATDILLVVDALELLYQHRIRRFCLVASDSDYTPLVRHLRSLGCYVLGIGMETTSQTLQRACDLFDFLYQLPVTTPASKQEGELSNESKVEARAFVSLETEVLTAYNRLTQGLEWILISDLEKQLKILDPSFTPQRYHHRNLNRLIHAKLSTLFEVRPRPSEKHLQEVRRREA